MAKKQRTKAEELATQQREISVSEFFAKNRHLLGFDNPRKALLTTIKEAVDNSLDACEEASILPDIFVQIVQVKDDRFRIIVEDNGPGIVKEQIPKIFAKLLYGSKFHRLKQQRGQQGIGISASALYGQLTTGKSIKIQSTIGKKYPAHYYELQIDMQKNEPQIVKDVIIEWDKVHGTRLEIELQGKYQKGKQSVDEYLKETALANPHASLHYKAPDGENFSFPRVVKELPREAKSIKPHPYGIELGVLIRMMGTTKATSVTAFLQKEFSRVSARTAREICHLAQVNERSRPKTIMRKEAEKLYDTIQKIKIIAPPTDCLSPIGEEVLIKGLKKEILADFYSSTTRSPAVYRGNPFQVECAIAYGGNLEKEGSARIMRFANKVPLLYQPRACATTEAVIDTSWKNYGLSQSRGSLPQGPVIIVIHIASAWVPFTSESKEAIAHYPEILKEIKLALQESGRKLAVYIRKAVKAKEQAEKINLFEKYIPELSIALSKLTGDKKTSIERDLTKAMKKILPQIIAESGATKADVKEAKEAKEK